MWQPRVFGIVVGWLAAAALAVFILSDQMVKAGLFGDACKQYGLSALSRGALPKFLVWAPDMFIYFLKLPFTYDRSTDLLDAVFLFMALGSSVAYALALVAANYWVWKLNQF